MKNYYQILNIRPNATDAEIKRSYRVLAKRYHPDVNSEASAAEKFADINEANMVLSDPKARAEYDIKLKEAAAPRPNPDEVMARQRAQAQAAARQAARQAAAVNNMMRNGANPNVVYAQQRMRAQQAAQAAQAQAQMQAQVNAMRDQSYRQGYADAQAQYEKELKRLNDLVTKLTTENRQYKSRNDESRELKKSLADAERDRRELENELFNRDRELAQEKLRAKDIETQLQSLRNRKGENAALKLAAEEKNKLQEQLDAAQQRIHELEQNENQIKLKNKAQLQLQQDKRRQMQKEIDTLTKRVNELTAELEQAQGDLEQWQQYAKSEDFLSDAERRIEEWNKKTQADKRKAKPTLYGVLGVLIWATAEEIEAAHTKLVKRFAGKTANDAVAKLQKIEEAYAVLSDEDKRKEYNASIDVTEEQIESERKLIAEFESIQSEYRAQLANKEFWEHYDDLNAAALAGDADAQNTLGEMLYYGDEIEQNLEQAVYWFKESAKQKHAEAMYNLGICFVNGEGTEQNKTTGLGFIRQAAKLGSENAKKYNAARR